MEDIDKNIIVKAAHGDLEAFEEIYRRTKGFVYAVALKVCGNTANAEDVVQEVFVGLYRSLSSFKFNAALKTWVYRITVNAALNYCRSNKRQGKADVVFDDVAPVLSVETDLRDEVDKKERAFLVRRLLDDLSPDHKICLILRELEGLSYAEIARALKVNINTVRSRLKRAREALFELAQKENFHAMR